MIGSVGTSASNAFAAYGSTQKVQPTKQTDAAKSAGATTSSPQTDAADFQQQLLDLLSSDEQAESSADQLRGALQKMDAQGQLSPAALQLAGQNGGADSANGTASAASAAVAPAGGGGSGAGGGVNSAADPRDLNGDGVVSPEEAMIAAGGLDASTDLSGLVDGSDGSDDQADDATATAPDATSGTQSSPFSMDSSKLGSLLGAAS